MEREGKKRLNSEKEYENIQKKSRRACWLASETTHDSTTSTDGVEWNGEREKTCETTSLGLASDSGF